MLQCEENMAQMMALCGFGVYEKVLHVAVMNSRGQGDSAKLGKIPHLTGFDYFIRNITRVERWSSLQRMSHGSE